MRSESKTILVLMMFCAFQSATAQKSHAASIKCDPTKYICLNKTCETLGVTTIDLDRKNLLACLLSDSGSGYAWKAMNKSDEGGAQAFYYSGGIGGGFSGVIDKNVNITSSKVFLSAHFGGLSDEDDVQQLRIMVDGGQCGLTSIRMDRADYGGWFNISTDCIATLTPGTHNFRVEVETDANGSDDGPCSQGTTCNAQASLILMEAK